MSTKPHFSLLATSFAGGPRPRNAALILGGLWLAIFFAALFSPPLLDDADATHAQAAQHIARTGDLVTLRVDGVRYLEKAPLPYWLAALSFRIFGFNTFAAHLPQAIAVLLLALLGHRWANQAFGSRTAFYTAIAILTATGTFLFTRILIPEALLSLFLATALFAFLKSLAPTHEVVLSPQLRPWDKQPEEIGASAPEERSSPAPPPHPVPHSAKIRVPQVSPLRPGSEPPPVANGVPEQPAQIPYAGPLYPYLMWSALALAVLTKGLVSLVFFLATTVLYLLLTGETRQSLPRLKPLTGALLFLAIAAPWHILAALHNPGFLRFYFWNEHVLRFLGRRTPADFNRLPASLYWTLHLVWLFPWSLFLPLGIAALERRYNHQTAAVTGNLPAARFTRTGYLALTGVILLASALAHFLHVAFLTYTVFVVALAFPYALLRRRRRIGLTPSPFHYLTAPQRTILLLSLFAAIVLLFFSLSTNQEYYTFPAYLPILLLIAATITRAEQTYASSPHARRWISVAHAALFTLGLLISLTLVWALFASRAIPSSADIGVLLAHRNAAGNTLSLSHLLDLTPDAFACLRLPSLLAVAALTLGPAIAWLLRMQRRHIAATTAIAFTSATFLIAAHLALARFAPVLSSKAFADRIQQLKDHQAQVLIFGDQAYGSSLPFYLGHPVALVDGRSTSLLFGSTDPETASRFLNREELHSTWGRGERKLLFFPEDRRSEADTLTPRYTLLDQSNKLLLTDRPFTP